MAKKDDEQQQSTQTIDPLALVEALKQLPADTQAALLKSAGLMPTTMGMTPEHLQVLMGTMTAVSANAQKEAIRSQRRENPQYPERSEFHPRGVFDDAGRQLEPKLKFRIPTFFQGVRLAGELETEEEIRLCNQITDSRYAREGLWKAEIEGMGRNQRLVIRVNREGESLTMDDRMSLPPFTIILRELISGKEAVNPETLHAQIEAMQKRIAELEGAKQPAGAAA